MYDITKYSYNKAKQLGVKIKPSTNKNKKIDVYDYHNNFINSIGAIGYKDYPTYVLEKGKKFADERRRLYRIRHEKDLKVLGSAGYYANKILW
jgi:hypothetical protein